jgi:Ca-activated chloride channel family protein
MMFLPVPSVLIRSSRLIFWFALSFLILSHSSFSQQANNKDAILILDASGSMWGQINGINKIVIAKDVVEGLVRNLPETQRLGFVSYGHRRKGDCGDIETLSDVGTDRRQLIAQLRELSPKGKTPLTKSVEHAANKLNYTKNAASVILVSDGLETCEADPCALARTLEQNGLDFTIHVIGFDVTREERAGLQCLADETGGQFLAAGNADELGEALNEVAIAPTAEPEAVPTETEAEAVPSTLVLKATILSGGPLIQSKLDWKVIHPADGGVVFSANDAGVAEIEILPGRYLVEATWNGWKDGAAKYGKTDVEIREQNTHVVTVPIDLALPVTLEVPDAAAEGTPIQVRWSGPDELGATVSVNRLDDAPSDFIYFFASQKERAAFEARQGASEIAEATLIAPIEPGAYEIRYTLSNPRIILARRPLTVTDAEYSLSVPEEVSVSSPVEVAWEGPLTEGDLVTLVRPHEKRAFDNKNFRALKAGSPVKLVAPAEPGDYEIRYVMTGPYTTYEGMAHSVQTSVPIRVTSVAAAVEAPATAIGGSTIEIAWQGPADGWQDDFISVVAVGAEKPNRDSRTQLAKGADALNPAAIRVPAIAGDYEVVYGIVPGNKIIARAPIRIISAEASVDAPDSVKIGEDFEVSYRGDGFKGDRVVVVAADAPDEKMWGYGARYGFVAKAGETTGLVHSRFITEPGAYEVRYITGMQHQVLARDTLIVTD